MTTPAAPKKRPATATSKPAPPMVSKKMREAAEYVITRREKALRNLAKY
jgi:hypothetical protein